jgi:D-serine deaminase-like pyridoxal phosphate-dependent protein
MGDLTGFQDSPDYKASMDKEAAIAVLTAMITPAVLISACGSMILSTSTRLGRVVDRVRSLSDRLESMAAAENHGPPSTE